MESEHTSSSFLDIKSNSRLKPAYKTHLGEAWVGDSRKLLKLVPDGSIDLIVTSPPYALLKQKKYGNVSESNYIRWFRPFIREFHRVLSENGSLVLNIGGAWNSGQPTRSLYQYKLLLELCDPSPNRVNPPKFHLAQEFYWFNPAKIPNPAQWVTIERIRVKDAVEHVWWLSKTERPRANNRNVLIPYSKSMQRLLKTGKYNSGARPSGWNVSEVWAKNNGGAIPPNILPVTLEDSIFNLLIEANTSSNDSFRRWCREMGITAPHPAAFPAALPRFFILFLSEPNDVVLDPFAGSNTTGYASETLERRWLSFEKQPEYVEASAYRWNELTSNGGQSGLVEGEGEHHGSTDSAKVAGDSFSC